MAVLKTAIAVVGILLFLWLLFTSVFFAKVMLVVALVMIFGALVYSIYMGFS